MMRCCQKDGLGGGAQDLWARGPRHAMLWLLLFSYEITSPKIDLTNQQTEMEADGGTPH